MDITPFISDLATVRIKLRKKWEPSPHIDHQLDWCTFPTWVTRFVTSLGRSEEKGKSMDQLINEIKTAPSNRARVNIVLNNEVMREKMEASIAQAMEFVDTISSDSHKDLDQSRKFMKEGSKLFNENEIKEAFDCFHKGICVSPFPGEAKDAEKDGPLSSNLALCLVKRSRCYQALKKYPEAWCDLKDAIANIHDPRLSAQLLKSKRALLYEITSDESPTKPLENQELADLDFSPMDVWIKPENRNLHAACESLDIAWSNEKGRYIVASRPIRPGTNVIAEPPYAAWLQPIDYNKYCFHCLRPLDNRCFPCRECVAVSYCSSECSELSWSTYHSVECKYLPFLKHLSLGHLALKTLLIAGFEKALEINSKPSPPIQTQKRMTNTYKDIHTLMDSIAVFDPIKTSAFTTCACYMALIAKAIGLIGEDQLSAASDLFLKTILQIILNGLTIYDDRAETSQPEFRYSYFSTTGDKKIGIGLYATTSLLSHSCDANTDRIFIGSKLVITSRAVIQKGNEVNICYGPSKLEGFKSRQENIKENFYFECRCDVCKTKQ